MFKSLLLAATVCVFAAATTVYPTSVRAADDDVFIDEGDGDFDVMPIPPAETAKAAPAPKASKKKQVAEAPAPVAEEPANELNEEPQSNADLAKGDDSAPVKPVKKKHIAKKASGAAGLFVTTTDNCPMRRSPASEAEQILVVKPSKKIWVERAGQGWYKGWDKSGSEGYLSSECVK